LRAIPDLRRGEGFGAFSCARSRLASALFVLVCVNRYGVFAVERNVAADPEWVWLPLRLPWYVPLGSTVAFVFGCILARTRTRDASGRTRRRDDGARVKDSMHSIDHFPRDDGSSRCSLGLSRSRRAASAPRRKCARSRVPTPPRLRVLLRSRRPSPTRNPRRRARCG
jgi:hypothetical protein